ncbi:helix-turn-helix domain-containing protein [Fluoribacter dumoffii]|uniref:helix-turn-helix domain-containing protein n=2 Tax=Fluoribacter dumoffii TaxID=463 RepID=UPI002ADDDC49|nr:helix-turn-helix domain-containing protein [Fluoribacter dumoffii]
MIDQYIHPVLMPYVKNIQLIEEQEQSEPYQVYPGPFIVMGFQYQGGISLITKETQSVKLKNWGITGLLTQHRTFQANSKNTKSVLIFFYPWAIAGLLRESAQAFTDQSLGLSDFINESILKSIEEKIQSIQDPNTIIQLIQNFLIELFQKNNHNYSSQQGIIHIAKNIITKPSQDTIWKLAQNYGISRRSLERHFQSLIGISPKRFMMTTRFQKALQEMREGKSWSVFSQELDYYDQSHFIKEFQQLTGMSPKNFLKQI